MSLVSCSSVPDATKELVLYSKDGGNIQLSKNSSIGKVEEITLGTNKGTIFSLKLGSNQEAKKYVMERRMILLKKFENIIEPYFGTANAVLCQENIKSDILINKNDSVHAVLQLLSLGENRVLNDCLAETNTHWLRVEMINCKDKFYDIRIYQPISQGPLPYETYFRCP